MDQSTVAAQDALQRSGLKLDKLTPSQKQQALNEIAARIRTATTPQHGVVPEFTFDFACVACTVGLNVVAAIPIGAIIAAGIAVGPGVAAVVAVATALGADAAAVATVINTVLAAGGGASVEGVISALCQNFGACS